LLFELKIKIFDIFMKVYPAWSRNSKTIVDVRGSYLLFKLWNFYHGSFEFNAFSIFSRNILN